MTANPPTLVARRSDGRLSKAVKLANGGIRVPAALTRTGVLEYRRADGSIQREYRSPEEVFHADSLASLSAVPVTDLHPPEMVSTANYERFARGHVGDSVRADGDVVAADVIVNSGSLISKIDKGDATEISCGYECTLDMTPGVAPDGKPYDASQRNIRYNHAALGPRGWGRAGASASLRLDSNGHELLETPEQRMDSMPTFKIDGLDLDAGSPAFAQAFAKLVGSVDTLTSEVAKQTGRADAAEGEVKDLKAKLVSATSPEAVAAAVAERTALVDVAAKFLPADTKFDGLDANGIKRAVVAHCRKEMKLDGKSAEYVQSAFDVITAGDVPGQRVDHTGNLRRVTSNGANNAPRRTVRADRITTG